MKINSSKVSFFRDGRGEGGEGEQVFGDEEFHHFAQLEAVAGGGRVVAQLTLAQAVARAVRIKL